MLVFSVVVFKVVTVVVVDELLNCKVDELKPPIMLHRHRRKKRNTLFSSTAKKKAVIIELLNGMENTTH